MPGRQDIGLRCIMLWLTNCISSSHISSIISSSDTSGLHPVLCCKRALCEKFQKTAIALLYERPIEFPIVSSICVAY